MQYREYQLNSSDQDSRIGAGYLERKSRTDLFQYQIFQEYHLSVLLEGSGVLIDREANSYPLTPNSVFQLFPGQMGSLYVDFSKPWREFQITLGAPTVQALLAFSSFHERKPVFQIELYPHLSLWMNDIVESFSDMPPALMIENYFDLQRLILDIHMQKESPEDAFSLSLIRRASVLVLRDSGKPVSVSELSQTFFVSQAKLTRIFRKYTHTTPLKYLQHLRFCYADRLLHEGHSIPEVAALFGYADQFSFSRQFKQIMGISPSVSRKSRVVASPVDTSS